MRRIGSHLFIGPLAVAEDVPRLRRRGVTAVLSLQRPGIDIALDAFGRMRAACEPAVAFHNVAIADYDPQALIDALPTALEVLGVLLADGRVVYLHCSEGINRAPSVALAHLVLHERLTLARAVTELRRLAPLARPYAEVIAWLGTREPA